MNTVTSSAYLELTCKYSAGNNKVLKVSKFRDTLDGAAINSFSDFIADNQILYGDSLSGGGYASFVKIVSAKKVDRTLTSFDLT